jgi:hypothetical protein
MVLVFTYPLFGKYHEVLKKNGKTQVEINNMMLAVAIQMPRNTAVAPI